MFRSLTRYLGFHLIRLATLGTFPSRGRLSGRRDVGPCSEGYRLVIFVKMTARILYTGFDIV